MTLEATSVKQKAWALNFTCFIDDEKSVTREAKSLIDEAFCLAHEAKRVTDEIFELHR